MERTSTSEMYTSRIASELSSYSTVPAEPLLVFCDFWVFIKVQPGLTL